jgi:ribosomal protein S13
MTRLFGILIEENKELWLCLCDIPGVSKKISLKACKDLGLFSRAPWKKITDKQRRSI